jgi:hypothetical protein
MKIYNYTDTNIIFNGQEIDEKEIFLPTEVIDELTHNSFDISNIINENSHLYITNLANGYQYETINYYAPNIFDTATILITYFGIFFTIKLVQKIKSN